MTRIAVTLYNYFPFGGLQRDALRIATELRDRGCSVRFYVLEWEGSRPTGMEVRQLPVKSWQNWRRNEAFIAAVLADLASDPVDRVLGFNRMSGLDFHYAADPCFAAKLAAKPFSFLYRLSGRYRHFLRAEAAVFSQQSATHILQISEMEQAKFLSHYHTPIERMHMLPPGIARDRCRPADAALIRQRVRAAFGVDESELVLLSVGSGFRIKGIDRSLYALAALPESLRRRVRFWVVGQDDARPYAKLANELAVSSQVLFTGGRSDIPELMLAADCLLHPAYHENTGTVLLEALVAGLPVICSQRCGYAPYLQQAQAGIVLPEPFSSKQYVQALLVLAEQPEMRARMQQEGLAYAAMADIYDMPSRAADLILSLPVRRYEPAAL
ncbi:MAG TPA: glycosyltransferase family 4 protein [Permianibacter sp.]|nr:glycosyltransferase family 4 protein [Permianibacter sp.]